MHILQKLLALCLLSGLSPLYAQTTVPADTDTLYKFCFIPEREGFYTSYKENQTELERMFAFIDQHRKEIIDRQIPLYVDGYSTLQPTQKQNLALARQRSNRVKSELITRKGLNESSFITGNHARNGEMVTVSIHLAVSEPLKTVVSEKAVVAPEEKPEERVVLEKKALVESEPIPDTTLPVNKVKTQRNYNFALRANLLHWATLTPDLGIEWRISQRIGILVDGSWTSWSRNDGDRRYALWKVSPEIHYYMGKQQRGFLGIMYHKGGFNYKPDTTGKQGDYQGGGITGGYQLALNRCLSLDFHAGVGYTRFDYDKYRLIDGVRVRQGNSMKNYWGINQLGITLVWKLVK